MDKVKEESSNSGPTTCIIKIKAPIKSKSQQGCGFHIWNFFKFSDPLPSPSQMRKEYSDIMENFEKNIFESQTS